MILQTRDWDSSYINIIDYCIRLGKPLFIVPLGWVKFVIVLCLRYWRSPSDDSDQLQLEKTGNLRAICHRTTPSFSPRIHHVLHQPRNSILLIGTIPSWWRRRIHHKTELCLHSTFTLTCIRDNYIEHPKVLEFPSFLCAARWYELELAG